MSERKPDWLTKKLVKRHAEYFATRVKEEAPEKGRFSPIISFMQWEGFPEKMVVFTIRYDPRMPDNRVFSMGASNSYFGGPEISNIMLVGTKDEIYEYLCDMSHLDEWYDTLKELQASLDD